MKTTLYVFIALFTLRAIVGLAGLALLDYPRRPTFTRGQDALAVLISFVIVVVLIFVVS